MNRTTTSMLAGAMIAASPALAAEVTPERLINADHEPQNWLMNDRTYDGQRFSPLSRINRNNVKDLKLAFAVPLGGQVGNGAIDGSLARTERPCHSRCYPRLGWSTCRSFRRTCFKFDLQVLSRAGYKLRSRVPMRTVVIGGLVLALTSTLAMAEPLAVKIGYLGRTEKKAAISLIEVPPDNNGVAGARLALEDNNTTGKFLNQHFSLDEVRLNENDDPVAALAQLTDRGISLFIIDLAADALLKVADAERSRGLVFFNVGAIDDRLREEDCRPNVIHAAPTRSMLADALAQYLVVKRWLRWLLVVGSHESDKLYAQMLRRAAARFGGKIVQERVFEDTGGARRTDSGLVQVQRQMPLFLQGAPEHDVLVAADESEVFASYLPYRTREPRPVAGSAGLVPKSWDAALDQWGADQLQSRFIKMFSRRMTALDGQAWTAARMIGEAAARVRSADPKAFSEYLRSPDFALAAFKGQKLTLRDWNLQLRQPILLSDGRTIVSVSPQEGFLHQFSELDTLGYDRPETKCRLK